MYEQAPKNVKSLQCLESGGLFRWQLASCSVRSLPFHLGGMPESGPLKEKNTHLRVCCSATESMDFPESGKKPVFSFRGATTKRKNSSIFFPGVLESTPGGKISKSRSEGGKCGAIKGPSRALKSGLLSFEKVM